LVRASLRGRVSTDPPNIRRTTTVLHAHSKLERFEKFDPVKDSSGHSFSFIIINRLVLRNYTKVINIAMLVH
jgi:hypothetical protein